MGGGFFQSGVNCVRCLFSSVPLPAAQPPGPCSEPPAALQHWGREAGGDCPELKPQPAVRDGDHVLRLDCLFGRWWEWQLSRWSSCENLASECIGSDLFGEVAPSTMACSVVIP